MDTKALAERLVGRCLTLGGDAAEVYLETGRNLSIEVRNGEIETVQEAGSRGVGLRVFVQGRMALASSNDFEEASLDDAVRRAVAFARITTADPDNALPEEQGVTAVEGLYDPAIARVPLDRKIELLRTLEALALKDPRITKSAGAAYGEGESEVVLANSNGLSKSYRTTACSIGISVVAEKGDQKSSGGEFCARRRWADLKPAAEIAAAAARKAGELLDPRPMKTQKAAVIFDPEVAYAVLGGIIQAVNGERVLQGASFLGAKLGRTIASALLTLVDDGTRAGGLSSAPFDGEGVPTRKRTIVEKGILKGFLYNTIVAKRAGVRSTGNASRNGFASLPGIGPRGFYMEAGVQAPEDIIKATAAGLWLKEATGYGINPVNGHFSAGASGLWVENGRVAFPVKGVTIAGAAEAMLSGIDMVGSDLDLNRRVAAPTFRVAQMQIGGD
ncbi:MAG: TldD/PmbA family protein [Candidatus Aminicenantes bacterium]|nr:TldD/PmbA family protein [Candidatus Aminicenantes bacterium]